LAEGKHEEKGKEKIQKQEKGAPAEQPSVQKGQKPRKAEPTSIIRIAGRDLRGDLPLLRAITSIKGIGPSLGSIVSKIICKELEIDVKKPIGEFSEEQIKRLEKIVESIPQYSLPSYLFNRRRDRITGQDMHLIGSDLTFSTKQDVQHNIDIDSWTGYRHFYGQKVRGQRTRTTGRTGMAVGVLRKSILAKAGAGAPSAAAAQEASAAAKGPAGVAAPAGAPAAKGMPATAKGAGAPKEGAKAPGAAAGAAKPTEKKKEEKK